MWVSQWNHSQWNGDVWDLAAAVAGIVLDIDVEGVLVLDKTTMARRRHLRHHEQLVPAPLSLDLVLDCTEIQLHRFGDFLLEGLDARPVFTLQYVKGLPKITTVEGHCLANLEFNFPDLEWARAVVDGDHGVGDFVGVEDVLVEGHEEAGRPLLTKATEMAPAPRHNAPALAARDKAGLLLQVVVLLELNWWLVDYEELLVLQELFVGSVDRRLDGVLHFSVWALLGVVPSPYYGPREQIRQGEFEWDGIVTWRKGRLKAEASAFEVEVLHAVAVVDPFGPRLRTAAALSIVDMMPHLFRPVVTAFLSTLDSELEMGGLEELSWVNPNVDLSEDLVAWIVEWPVCLDVEVASLKFGLGVDTISHINN